MSSTLNRVAKEVLPVVVSLLADRQCGARVARLDVRRQCRTLDVGFFHALDVEPHSAVVTVAHLVLVGVVQAMKGTLTASAEECDGVLHRC